MKVFLVGMTWQYIKYLEILQELLTQHFYF